jgi:GAF domain-containing protein
MQPVRGNAKAPPGTLRNARIAGFDSIIAAPMLRKGKVVGALVTAHREAKVFDARQVALIKSFADQAVIAIENARLFNETKEALEHQRASGDIHGTITGSMADTRPVFDAIARNALRLFDTCYAAVFLLEGEMLNLATVHGDGAFVRRLGGSYKKFRDSFPQPVDYSGVTGIAVRTGKVAQIAPIIGNPRATPRAVALAKAFGYDAMVIQPLVRGGKVIGIIGTNRREAKPFNERELRLLKTFADQAVIAIENARLFNETKEALEQQTATAEILKVISESPTNTQPVFEAIVQSGLRLFPNAAVAVVLPAGNEMHMVAVATQDPSRRRGGGPAFRLPCRASASTAPRSSTPSSSTCRTPRPKSMVPWGRHQEFSDERQSRDYRHADDARRSRHRRDQRHPGGSRPVERKAAGAATDLCRAGGDRDRECAPVQRDQGSTRAADGDGGHPQGHFEFADRC